MEGIGAAEIVLIHRTELRDSLVRQRSAKQRRVRLPGGGWRARGSDLARLIGGWGSWWRTAYTDTGPASPRTQMVRNGVHASPERDTRRQINEQVGSYSGHRFQLSNGVAGGNQVQAQEDGAKLG
jgi:hypothetical protein